jgi:hypothetical protein
LFWNITESVARKKYFSLKSIRERKGWMLLAIRRRGAPPKMGHPLVGVPDDPLAPCSALARGLPAVAIMLV